jgi:hypothetical protein
LPSGRDSRLDALTNSAPQGAERIGIWLPGQGAVGWSICRALARAQLRRGASVVLDGVARPGEIDPGPPSLAVEELDPNPAGRNT